MSDLKLVNFPIPSLQDIPAKLRQFADWLENPPKEEGFEYFEGCENVVLLLRGQDGEVHVHGFGQAEWMTAYYMCGRAQRIMDSRE